ncbi:MAG: phosphoribosylformylglycinamidine synthase subunit PurL [Candidatus Dadabacteria bacterium]|nr:phosphoribosylformylglycinamidine synthase subunit PurL [Candidatus Dadabacteria bacterium]NIQ14533.1 phosphoribosylformylglycinamidine synthase subunit PurL [Candidatus Dadabacteria bacterium]
MSTDNILNFAIEHGLTKEEFNKIESKLGRKLNLTEVGILGAMWSEHCSYKSSRIHLKKLPTSGSQVIQGPGENAGIVDIEDDDCVVFKMESHNHPSFIEPYQGAATGVGGILRDIFTMGARPVAVLDSLRFGNPSLPKTKYLVEGVVSGIAGYGNCIGIPTIGGEIYFDDCYDGNPLVNVFALGITKKNKIFKGYANGPGNPVIYVGSKTGRDGIQGAIMASDTFTEESEQKRPAVQVGDPFAEKLLLEACLELFETDAVIGIQDMGAAGLTSSSTEMADRAGTGLEINIDKVPRREERMSAYEVLLSESQERMLMVLQKGKEHIAEEIFKKWNLDFSVIGMVTNTKKLTITENNEIVADLPIDLITSDAPSYDRPYKKPEYLDDINKFDPVNIPIPDNLTETIIRILSSPTIANKKWVYEQYDYMVRTNTVEEPGSDSSVIRLKGSNKAIAMSSNCNSRYCYLNPREGAKITVAENARNLACSGAVPLAITDCLNFGNPENPEIMWQFKECIEGMSEAAEKLNTPVVSGNVSFYNETEGTAIFPTPTVGMVGLIKNVENKVSQWFRNDGDVVIILGETLNEIGGSEYLKIIHGEINGTPPSINLELEKSLISSLIEGINQSIIISAHDISEGGIAVALAECCFNPNGIKGALINTDSLNENNLREDILLFSETQSRVIITVNKNNIQKLKDITSKFNTPMKLIGVVVGKRLVIEDIVDIPISELYDAWAKGFEKNLIN